MSSRPGTSAPELKQGGRTVLGSRLWLWVLTGFAAACVLPAALHTSFLLSYDLALVALFAYERALLRGTRLELRRETPRRMAAHGEAPVVLHIHHRAARALRITIQQDGDDALTVLPPLAELSIAAKQSLVLRHTLRATCHGIWALGPVGARVETRLGVAARIEQLAATQPVCVLPSSALRTASQLPLKRVDPGALPQPTSHAAPGSEIDALRGYVPGDPLRAIDWKASAKRRRPIARSYQPERGQTLWLVIDASRVMSLPLDVGALPNTPALKTRFEAALEAALALADAALVSGDSVALMVHAQSELLAVPPRRGRSHFRELVERVVRVQSGADALDVSALLRALRSRAAKRSCVVLFTDLDNQGDLSLLAEQATLLTRRHLCMCVTLSAQHLTAAAQQTVCEDVDAYRKLAALELLGQRSALRRKLRESGMSVVESPALALSRAAVQRYREVKLSGRM